MKHLSAFIAIVMLLTGLAAPTNASTCSNPCYRGNTGHTGYYPSDCGPDSDELEIVWTFQTRDMIRATPVTDENNIYFGAGDNKFYCLNKLSGQKVWDYTIGERCENSNGKALAGSYGSPTLDGGKIYFGTVCGNVVCLDAKKGSKLWQYSPGAASYNSATVLYKDRILLTRFDERVDVIDTKGNFLYMIPCKTNFIRPPAIDGSVAFIPYEDGVICYDLDKRSEIMRGKMKAMSLLLPGGVAARNGKVFYGSMLSELFCYDGSNGDVIWKNLFMIENTPCITNDSVYVVTLMGLECLSINNGTSRWTAEIEGLSMASPVVCGKRVYVGAGNLFYAFSDTGEELYKLDVGETIFDSIMCSNGFVYFSTDSGMVYCLGPKGAKSKPSKIILTPESSKIATGTSVNIRADVFDSGNNKIDDPKITWTVSPKDMGTIADGVFTAGQKTGRVTITGCVGSICDSADIEIADVSDFISRVSVDPAETVATVGIPVYFTAKAIDKKGKDTDYSDFKWSVDPKSAGTIEQNGTFTPNDTGECTITASIGKISGTAKVKILKIASISIDPTSALVNFGKTQQFTVTVLDNTGAPFENPDLKWTCDPTTLGKIDKTGLFTAGNSELDGKIIVSGYGLTAEATMRVEEVRQAIISVESPEMVFDQIDPGKAATTKIVIKNDGNIPDDLKITTDADWIQISPKQVTIDPKSKSEITVILKSSALKKGATLAGKITIQGTKPDPINIDVKVTVNLGQYCFSTNDLLEFGKVARGSSKTMTMTIGFTGNQTGKIVPNVPWITVTPNSFSNVRSLEVSVTIAGSTLPAGENFEGLIGIVGDDSCRDTNVKVTVQTDKDIRIRLTLGSISAEINGYQIVLNAPPVKIKGTTMVPIRFISEAFGCKVDWEANEKKITITRGTKIIVLYLDKKDAYINGQKVTMTAPPTSVNGKTVVPVRFIAETFGAKVNFDAGTGVITIEYTPN